MSTSSPRILRNGKILFQSSSDTVIRSSSINLSPNMESNTYPLDEQIQSGRNSLANRMSSQQVNEERMNHLQNEMSKPKAIMERPIEQNEGRNKQTDASAATLSFAVRASNMVTNTKLLQTHVPNFRGSKDKYHEFEHLQLNHFRPIANEITEEDKIHFFKSILRDEAIDFWQTITITPPHCKTSHNYSERSLQRKI